MRHSSHALKAPITLATVITLGLAGAAPALAEQPASSEQATNRLSYAYNASLYDEQGNYPGVYSVALKPSVGSEASTIGIPSIADENLSDAPTTESPAIIQGAAVGFENKTGATEFQVLKERVAPYSYFRYSIMEQTGQDGVARKKVSGFDGTYVIVRLNVAELFRDFDSNALTAENAADYYLHVKQENNKALLVATGQEGHTFSNVVGSNSVKTGAYRLSEMLDANGKDTSTPYFDVVLLSSAANVAGADAGKEGSVNGDVPLHFYVDKVADYNPSLTYDPASTDPNHIAQCLAKFYDEDAAKQQAGDNASRIGVSSYVVKGSDLALETLVENSGGAAKNSGTTYWSLAKSLQHAFYDQAADKSASDAGCGRTVKLMSEVPVLNSLEMRGADASSLRKRTLDVNSFDIQIANNTNTETQVSTAGLTLENAWLKLCDNSNTTGAELAVGNNATMVIDAGGKLIIDKTAQLEVEWDGSTTAPASADSPATPTTPDTLNDGVLDLRAGGEIENNGVITIEGKEGKPVEPAASSTADGAATSVAQQIAESAKGNGELYVQKGATLTNNGCIMLNGVLFNMGTLVNNGKYDVDPITSNDPDHGQFTYHRGIQASWKDDINQADVFWGALYNGMNSRYEEEAEARLVNNGDIVLIPGDLFNFAKVENATGAHLYLGASDEAIIPIEPTAEAPTVETKRVKYELPFPSHVFNYALIANEGEIMPASVALNDNGSFGALSSPGKFAGSFYLDSIGDGKVTGSGKVYAGAGLQEGWNDPSGNGTWCYVRDGQVVTGWFLDAGSWYLADASGTMLTGWQQDAGHWYYLSQDHDGSFGAMRTGWLLDGGKWYWLSATAGGPLGAMATGWQLVGGTWYYLYPQTGAPKGSLAVSTTVDGYVVDANGAWVR